ncbi:MAG: DnaJ-like cysteine-rich domain-containing protein [Planctomycetota bacterium]|jgi:hypothetical protein
MDERTPEDHLRAAEHLAKALEALADARSSSGTGVLEGFAMGHLSDVVEALGAGDGEIARVAGLLRFTRSKDERVWGPREAVKALDLFVLRTGPEDKAAAAADRYTSSSDFMLRYAALHFELRHLIAQNKGLRIHHRNVKKFSDGLPGSVQEHVGAIAAGIELAGRCSECMDGRTPCPQCRGSKKIDLRCDACDGDGKIEGPHGDWVRCRKCRGNGYVAKGVRCPTCKGKGRERCSHCKGDEWYVTLPDRVRLSDVVTEQECPACSGRGTVFRNVARFCPKCGGLGALLFPAEKPTMGLPLERP